MTGIVLALGAALGWGISDFLGGRASRSASSLPVLGISQALGLVIALAVAAVAGLQAPVAADLLYAAAAGVAGVVFLGALYQGMAVGAMGLVSPIAASGTIIPVAFGIAGGERPTAIQGIGVAAAVSGVALASWRRSADRPGTARARLSSGVGFALIAAIGGGFTTVAINAASSGGVLWLLIVQRATVAAIALVATMRTGAAQRLSRGAWRAIAAVAVFDLTATALFALACTHGQLSLVSVIAALYPVVTVGLAYALLSERMATHQRVGTLTALAGAAAIAAGTR